MAHYFIKVEGEIIANDLVHYAQEWACGGVGTSGHPEDNYDYDETTHSVKGNLILDTTRRAAPYAIYCTENNGIAATSTGDIAAWSGYGAAVRYYKDNIAIVQKQLNDPSISTDLMQPLYRGLFTDVFSILELFLSDVILCVIYSNEEVFDKAVEYYKLKKLGNKQLSVIEIEKRMHNFFFREVVYHRFDKVVNILYKRIIGIRIPNHKKLSDYLHKRNNIVHRYSLSNIDRMRVTIISKEDIEGLIATCNTFTDKLVEKIKSKGYD